jgi:alpha-aminoadipic semialdehyde synthase
LDVLEQLPHVKVRPDDLKNLKNIVGTDQKKIIISQFTSEHLVKHKDGLPFNKADYYANSNNYVTKFAEEYLEHVHWLLNGVYWEAKYPRIISINELKEAVACGKSKLLGVCDISADYMGSLEFTSRFTSIEQPFLLYDPITEEFKETMNDANDQTILFHSVDHLPAEMPKEASNHFGEKLMPFVKDVVQSNFGKPFSEQTDLPVEIKNAVICAHGELTPKYKYITDLRAIKEKTK